MVENSLGTNDAAIADRTRIARERPGDEPRCRIDGVREWLSATGKSSSRRLLAGERQRSTNWRR